MASRTSLSFIDGRAGVLSYRGYDIHDVAPDAEKGIDPDVDFYCATVYYALGLPIDLYTPLFAVGRMGGWTAHVMEQHADNRLIRPRAEYVGATDRTWVPIDER